MKYSFKKRHILYGLAIVIALLVLVKTVNCSHYVMRPERGDTPGRGDIKAHQYRVPLDPESPWPRFRCNSLQNGRSTVLPEKSDMRPWTFQTGKGIFSSPVVDKNGTVYIGSADHHFYAIDETGRLKWKYTTGEIIDSSALLDDRGRVYVGSGDGHVYALDRETGRVLWRFKAHTPQEVTEQFGVTTYNLNWFEGNIAMLPDGTILAPNDNYLIYKIDRETGKSTGQFVINEMGWSLPAVNAGTGRIITGTNFLALKNVYAFDFKTGDTVWTAGGFGTNAASPMLTTDDPDGAAVVGGYDGILRAFGQRDGRQIWTFGARDHLYSSPAQLADGTIIQASTDGTVYAVDPERGSLKWAFDTMEPIRSSPAVDGGGRIYVGTGDGSLLCLNPDGTRRWAYRFIDDVRNDINGSPALGRKG
ncbi:MAG: PQQ-like beta-propeller repeat protein, partial [Spirochaetes bacterium]|nr:PQQ-like beta-propeller repeat protein [Spirochaetota bacterium]